MNVWVEATTTLVQTNVTALWWGYARAATKKPMSLNSGGGMHELLLNYVRRCKQD